jgi:uncharacterized protein
VTVLKSSSAAQQIPSHGRSCLATRSRLVHRYDSDFGAHLLVVNGSRIYDLDPDVAAEFDAILDAGDETVGALLKQHGLYAPPYVDDEAPRDLPMRSLSLAVAQKCNLGCTYCYAQGGEFGGQPKAMSWAVAERAVLRLLDGASPGDTVNLSFLGGEPLVARALVREVTLFAVAEARRRLVRVGFSITTNGTLLNDEDGDFFDENRFAVTVSIDGVGAQHDRLRPFRSGEGSYERIVERVAPLLRRQRSMQVSARVTITPLNLCLRETLDELLGLGFHSVGFSPMLAAPHRRLELQSAELGEMLAQMILCGRKFEAETLAGRPYPFSNLAEALVQLHRGTHRPYSCGAGAGYFGVSADGGIFACHRFVEDPAGALGDVENGPDRSKQEAWLADRHVHRQEPCQSCWARYLCGGGCHHEVIHRGRPACDFIRGWLDYCLTAYANLLSQRPDYFLPRPRSA